MAKLSLPPFTMSRAADAAEMRYRGGNVRPDSSPDPSSEPGPGGQMEETPYSAEEWAERPQANKLFTYALYFCLGMFGTHHFHLDRNWHAFLWLTTFGGFGLGFFRELWRLDEYVDDYNESPWYMSKLTFNDQQPGQGRPWTIVRLIGQYTVGCYYGRVFSSLAPESFAAAVEGAVGVAGTEQCVYLACGVVGAALGVYLVATLGRTQGSFVYTLGAAAVTQVLAMLAADGEPAEKGAEDSFFAISDWALIAAAAGFFMSSSRVKGPKKRRSKRRCPCCCNCQAMGVLLLALLFWGGVGWGTYEHGSIPGTFDEASGEQETIRFKDKIDNILNSPEVAQLWTGVGELWNHGMEHGWRSTWNEFVQKLDVGRSTRRCRRPYCCPPPCRCPPVLSPPALRLISSRPACLFLCARGDLLMDHVVQMARPVLARSWSSNLPKRNFV